MMLKKGLRNSQTLKLPNLPKSWILIHKKILPQDFIRKTMATAFLTQELHYYCVTGDRKLRREEHFL